MKRSVKYEGIDILDEAVDGTKWVAVQGAPKPLELPNLL
jgi:hypothetical protein